jgi:release factor glutamine methyltransferase
MKLNLKSLRALYSNIDPIDFCALVEYVMKWNRAAQWTHWEYECSEALWETVTSLLDRRLQGEPLAYITGYKEFYSRSFYVDPNVLIPRPETEILIDVIKDNTKDISRNMVVWDVGTGSGCIAITLKLERSCFKVFASDISLTSLHIAQKNAYFLDAPDISFIQMDLFKGVKLNSNKIDIIVSNPPYIQLSDPHLQQKELRHEPMGALTDYSDGLSMYRELCQCINLLSEGGMMIFEHGYDQAPQVRDIMKEAGFIKVQTQLDLSHIPRVTYGYHP